MFMRVLGIYEKNKRKAVEFLLRPGSIFVDAGANKGDFTLLAAKMLGNSGMVIAFEPEPQNFDWLRKSIGLNGYTNITIYQAALSDKNGAAELYLGVKSGWHSLIKGQVDRDRGVITVPIRMLDDILDLPGAEGRPCMIKIDVEGAELNVLRGAAGLLSRGSDVILLIDIHPDLGVNPKHVCDFLRSFGFSLFYERPPFDDPVVDCGSVTSLIARRM